MSDMSKYYIEDEFYMLESDTGVVVFSQRTKRSLLNKHELSLKQQDCKFRPRDLLISASHLISVA